MDSHRRLEEIFAHFPGIGPRQAKRFVYYLLSKSSSYIHDFTSLINELKKSTFECTSCHRIFFSQPSTFNHKPTTKNQLPTTICAVCSDLNRDHSSLMVVARDSDFESIEKSGAYKGLYFILGGTIPVLDKEPEKRIRIEKLLESVSHSNPQFKEIILSLNTTPEGEHTAEIVKGALQKVIGANTTKVSILGRGLSTGAELEYVDGQTIKSALENRH